ncbi:MAG TPA: CPBP family intramembrane glutamic endopeptidase [Terriglobales bacterium]|nr:CPBP family intramembrane glutamic endopeptidase [Terriglobales bacterium]
MIFTIAHLLVAYTILVMPWIGRYKYRKLQRNLAAGHIDARARFYRLTVVQQWSLVLLIVLFARAASLPWRALGLVAPVSWPVTRDLLIMFTIAIMTSVILFRLTGDRFLRRLLKMAGALIPENAVERFWFAAVSLGAGVTEELLFRGFLFWYLGFFFPQLSLVQLIVVSSLLFGFCHVYQGWVGIIGTGVLGAILMWMYLSTESLLLPMTVHALIDLRILAIFTPGRMRSLQCASAQAPEQGIEKADPSLRSG